MATKKKPSKAKPSKAKKKAPVKKAASRKAKPATKARKTPKPHTKARQAKKAKKPSKVAKPKVRHVIGEGADARKRTMLKPKTRHVIGSGADVRRRTVRPPVGTGSAADARRRTVKMDLPTPEGSIAPPGEVWWNAPVGRVVPGRVESLPVPADEHRVRELVLFATNDRHLYDTRIKPTIAMLQVKRRSGQYDSEAAVRAWRYLADDAARSFPRQFGYSFTGPDKEAAAREFEYQFRDWTSGTLADSIEDVFLRNERY